MSNKAFATAERKGREAAIAGKPESANPYGDARTHRGSVTFARAFWRAWRKGWLDVMALPEWARKAGLTP